MATRTTPKAKRSPHQESLWAQVRRHAKAQIRFLIAVIVGVAVALLAPFFLPIEQPIPRILAGWNAGGLSLIHI